MQMSLGPEPASQAKISKFSWNSLGVEAVLYLTIDTAFSLKNDLDLSGAQVALGDLAETYSLPLPCITGSSNTQLLQLLYRSHILFQTSKTALSVFPAKKSLPYPFPLLDRQTFICPLRHLKYHFLCEDFLHLSLSCSLPFSLDTSTKQGSIKIRETQPIKQLCSLPYV